MGPACLEFHRTSARCGPPASSRFAGRLPELGRPLEELRVGACGAVRGPPDQFSRLIRGRRVISSATFHDFIQSRRFGESHHQVPKRPRSPRATAAARALRAGSGTRPNQVRRTGHLRHLGRVVEPLEHPQAQTTPQLSRNQNQSRSHDESRLRSTRPRSSGKPEATASVQPSHDQTTARRAGGQPEGEIARYSQYEEQGQAGGRQARSASGR